VKKIYLGLGSNLGDKKKNLDEALERLKKHVELLKLSSYYRTEPVGYKDQDWFLNLVVEGATELTPEALLAFCQGIERDMKRVKTVRFGPRIIDVDILLYEGFSSLSPELTVPHPRMKERAFVMAPLAEIAPGLPLDGQTAAEIAAGLRGERIDWPRA
jgi:2-amino-4-hydroxy-6-hydroxymethyldihydropteridine diphosphokinase